MKIEKLSVCPEDGEQFEFSFGQGLCTIYDQDSERLKKLIDSLKQVFHYSYTDHKEEINNDMQQIYAVLYDDDDNKLGLKRRGDSVEVELLLSSGANEESLVCDSNIAQPFLKCNYCGQIGYSSLLFVPESLENDCTLKWSFFDEYVKQEDGGVVLSVDSDFLISHNGGVIKDAKKLLEKDIERLGPDEQKGYLKELKDFKNTLESQMKMYSVGNTYKDDLEDKCIWLKERITFLQSRMNSIKQVLNIGNEKEKLTEELKVMKSLLQKDMRRKKDAETLNITLCEHKEKLSSFQGGEQAYMPQILSEAKNLSNALNGLDRQLEDRDRTHKMAINELANMRNELVLINNELQNTECTMYSDDYVMNVEAVMANLRKHQDQISKLESSLVKHKSLISKIRISRIFTVLGLILMACSAVFGANEEFGFLNRSGFGQIFFIQSHWMMLFMSLSGVLMTLFGFLGIRKISGKVNKFNNMMKEKTVLLGQLAWDKNKLTSLLKDKTYEEYMEQYNNMAILRETKLNMEFSIDKLEREISKLDNELNLIKVRIKRSKERLYHILRPSGSVSVERYIQVYEEYRRQAVITNEISNKMKIILEGKPLSYLNGQIDDMISRLSMMEAKIERMDKDVINENLEDLKEEYELKQMELMSLKNELEERERDLNVISYDAEKIDVWEIASDLAETNIEIDNVKKTSEAIKIAITGFSNMIKDATICLGGEISSLANDILKFMLGEDDTRISYRIVGNRMEFTSNSIKPAEEDFFLKSLAVYLAVNEVTCARGTSPILCILPEIFLKIGAIERSNLKRFKTVCESIKIKDALKKLAKTRQVIWIINDGILNSIDEDSEQKLIAIA